MFASSRTFGGGAWLLILLSVVLTFIAMLAGKGNSIDAPILQYSAPAFGDALNKYIKRGFTNESVIEDNHIEGVWLAAPTWTQNYLSYCNNTSGCDSRSASTTFSLRTQIIAAEGAALEERFGYPDSKYHGETVMPAGMGSRYGISFDGQEGSTSTVNTSGTSATPEQLLTRRIAANATFVAGTVGGDLYLWSEKDQHSLGAAFAFLCIALVLELVVLLSLPAILLLEPYQLGFVGAKVKSLETLEAGLILVAAIVQIISAGIVTAYIKQYTGTSDPFKGMISGATWEITTSSTFLACTWVPLVLLLVASALLIVTIRQKRIENERHGSISAAKDEQHEMYH